MGSRPEPVTSQTDVVVLMAVPAQAAMRAQEVSRFLDWFAGLKPADREQVLACLAKSQSAEAFTRIVEGRLGPRPACHRCTSTKVVRNGRADGLQRYKCRHCGVSFNALSATPMARLRLRDKWAQYAALLAQGQSVRKCAAELSVHRTTAFRWRHRFLSLPCKRRLQALAGIVQADETYMLRSFKGQPGALLRPHAGTTPGRQSPHARHY